MSRSVSNLSTGILSVIDASEILGVSPPTVRRLFDDDKLPGGYRLPNSRERRIPAPGVMSYMIGNGMKPPLKLLDYVSAYRSHFGSASA